AIYTEPDGYYLVWERCCRNQVIDNIERPDTAGMTFYLEFPPVVRNGERFFNSTPTIFPPLSDFACKGFPYYVDFRGSDKDGDSLVYSLSHPLNGNSSVLDPIPTNPIPGPYSEVTFKPGYSAATQVAGSPPLAIDDAGFLTVTPDSTGLFVFAVKCEEFRDGVKIGEVRRDFQMLVLDCPDYFFPEITTINFSPDSSYNQTDTITYLYTEDSPCLTVTVKDFEANSEITAELRPLNFSLADVSLTPTAGTLSGPNDSLQLELCLPDCPVDVNGGVLAFEVIVKDNSCALPLMDTATFFVNVVPVPNEVPDLDLNIPFNVDSGYYFAEVELGNLLEFDVSALDLDGDSLALELVDAAAITAQLAAIGNFNFASASGVGSASSLFSWEPTNCTPLPEDTTEWFFPMQFTVTDLHSCQEFDEPDTVDVLIRVFYNPPNVITTLEVSPLQFDAGSNTFFAEINTNELLTLDIIGKAQDALVSLSAFSDNFNLADLGMQFTPIDGSDSIFTQFSWEPDCEDLLGAQNATFTLKFVVNSNDECTNLPNTDTLEVEIRLNYVPLPNEEPMVSTSLSDADTMVCDTLYLGERLDFEVTGLDVDGHFMNLMAQGQGFNLADYGIQFDEVSGFGQINQNFEFDVSCDPTDYPNPNLTQEELLVDFIVQDSSDCFIMTYDTITVKLLLIKETSPNNTPSLSADLPNFDPSTRTYTVDALVGETITFTVTGIDADQLDQITLSASGDGFDMADVNMDFVSVTGISPLTTTFTWRIDCEYLDTGFTPNTYTINLLVQDETKNCGVTNLDGATVIFNISDLPQPEFNPANAFSPNGDGIGDEYFISTLPIDDCTDRFIGIKIYNRWGKKVFESTDRNFKWDGLNVSAGIYFYEIEYENSKYKGTVHVLKE
ncbi:MAG: gliding motility-associated C-terminal domain-containing protein, partial [Flammeovirgaceae bacterium]